MRRTRLAGSTIRDIKERIKGVEKKREAYFNYLKKLQLGYSNGKISYSKYVETIYQKRHGRNIQEWIDCLDKYDRDYKRELKKEERKNAVKKTSVVFFSLAILGFLVFLFFSNFKPSFAGFAVKGNELEFSQKINLEFSQSQNYELPIQNEGKLSSLKLSGKIEGIGTAKIYLGDLLVYSGEINSEEALQIKEKLSPSQGEILPSEIPIKNFADICEQTCDLEKLNLTDSVYTLKIELSENMKLNLDEIKYGIIPETPENITSENVTTPITPETNITPEINQTTENATATNITTETNVTIPTPITNITTENITETNVTILTEENATIQTMQYQAVLNQKVKWKKQISPESTGNLTITLPKEAENIIVTEITPEQNKETISPISITGGAISASPKGFFARLFEGIFGITGRAISQDSLTTETSEIGSRAVQEEQSQQKEIKVDLEIDNVQSDYQVEYETPAPYAIEQETERGKEVKIVGLESVHYENVLSFTNLNEKLKIKDASLIKIYWREQGTYIPIQKIEDTNHNGIYDYVEWITPSLSNQTFDIIIEISKAEHLDNNKQFISDIYEQVKALDDIWSEPINNNEYVRVTFEQKLDSSRDITLYPRVVFGEPAIEVYEKNGNETIAEFTNLVSDNFNKIYLTNLKNSQDTFDLRVVGGSLQLDYIVDPSTLKTYYLQNGSGTSRIFNTTSTNTVSNWSITSRNVTGGTTGGFNWTANFSYDRPVNITAVPVTAIIYCRAATYTTAPVANISKVELYDCGASATCATGTVIATNTSITNPAIISGAIGGNCNSSLVTNNITATFNLTSNSTLTTGEYLGIGVYYLVTNATFNLTYGGSTYITRFNVTEDKVTEYPKFSNYIDDNRRYIGNATGKFNVTVTSTNGTVWLEINKSGFNVNRTAKNSSDTPTVFNATYNFGEGFYNYRWHAWGNGTYPDYNNSYYRNYTVNTSIDGNTTGNTTLYSAYGNLTTTQANDVIILFAGGANVTAQNVTSIIDTAGLSWTLRKKVVTATILVPTYMEEWYAVAPSVLTQDRINVTWSGDAAQAFVAFAIRGADTTIIFDTNTTVPSNMSYVTTNVTTNVSTNYANDLIISGAIAARNTTAACRTFTLGTGYTRIQNATTNSSIRCNYIDSQLLGVSTLQDKLAVYEIGSSATTTAYIIIADAIMLAGPPIEYPQFSGYWDDNGSLLNTGTGEFNVTVTSTNGTVLLEIGGVNVTAKNSSDTPTVFNATYTFSSGGVYPYKWYSWGNGTLKGFNKSDTRNYTVNQTFPINVTINSPLNTTYGTTNITFNITALSPVGVSSCYYSLNNGTTNYSMQNPNLVNMSNGFSTVDAGGWAPRGIATNNSDFWIPDATYNFVYHFNRTGGNITDGFSATSFGSDAPKGIATNGSDFWIVDYTDNFVYHTNRTGGNITDGFSTATFGASGPYGIATNKSDFWILDAADTFVYHTNRTGGNITDGFSTATFGASSPFGIATNKSDFWIVDYTDKFVYHTNRTGGNITDGFSILAFGANDPYGITTNVSLNGGTPTDFWITDMVDKWVYHFLSENSWIAVNSTMPQGAERVNYYCNNTANNLNYTEAVSFNINYVPNITNINWMTVGGSTSNNVTFGTIMAYFNATVIDSPQNAFSVNITLVDPDNIKIINNGIMSNSTYSFWNYSTPVTLEKAGNWTVNVTAFDGSNTVSNLSIITVNIVKQSTREGWYGYTYGNVSSVGEINDLINYNFELLELSENYTRMVSNWVGIKNATNQSFAINLRTGLNILWDYNYSISSEEGNATYNISQKFPELLLDPYSITLEYISIELRNQTGYSSSQLVNTTNNLAEAILMATNNKFPVYIKNYNFSDLYSAYVKYTPMLYMTGFNESLLMTKEIQLIRTNQSLNRIYYNLTSTTKTIAMNNHLVYSTLRSALNSTSLGETNAVSLNNLDVLVFNNFSTSQNFTMTLSEIPITGKDVWDHENKYVIETDTDNNFNVSVPPYSIAVLYFEDLDHMTINGLASTAYKQSVPFTGDMNYSKGQALSPPVNSWDLDSNNDILTELFDPHYYIKTNFITYYGWLNVSKVGYKELCDNSIIIIADKNNGEVDNLTSNCTSASEIYGYVSVFDYTNSQQWYNNKTADVNNWTDLNESMNIFLDGIDVGVGGANFSSRMKDVVDYIQIQKGKKVILNTYTAYQNFSTWGNGGVMKESCVNRWNGASSSVPDNYSRESWSLELNKSNWYHSQNIRVVCQAFNNRTTDGSNIIYNYTDLQDIYFASRVLGYDYFYLSQPDFNYPFTEYVYDVGNDLSSAPLTDDNETYYRLYSQGIIYYNTTSKHGWIDDGRVIQNSQVCFNLYDANSTGNVTFNFNINRQGIDDTGDYWFNDSNFSAKWNWENKCVNISNPPNNGRYLLEAWITPRSTLAGNGLNIGYAEHVNYSVYSYWDNSLVDSWNAYPTGRNWQANVLLTDTKRASIDTTLNINQTDTFNPANVTVNISSNYPFNISVYSDIISVNLITPNVTYQGTTLNISDSSDCDGSEPTFANTTIDGLIHGACRRLVGTNYSVRIKAPSLSERFYTIIAGAGPSAEYPQFSGYWDDNGSLLDTGTGEFNVTVTSTNGTVLLEIGGVNVTAKNSSDTPTVFNATYTFSSAGIYSYKWYSWGNGTYNNFNISDTRDYTVNESAAGNIAPNITAVYNGSVSINLNQGPLATSVIINFTAYDPNGDLNDSTATVNVSLANEITRQNSSCSRYQSSGNYANFTCNITMWWFDGAGNWNISTYILDNTSLSAKNDSLLQYVASTTGFDISPSVLSWPVFLPGSKNQTSNNDPIVINNTGNQQVGNGTGGTSNISINATNLVGEINGAFSLWANNFSVSTVTGGVCTNGACVECNGGNLSRGRYVNVSNSTLPKGNYTKQDATGQEQLYFCLRIIGNEVSGQPYSTLSEGTWTISIFLVALIPVRKKRKKTKLQDDKLLDALNIIADELKKEYSLNKEELLQVIISKLKDRYDVEEKEILDMVKSERETTIPITIFSKELGGLEAVAKYMKENLNMNYSEIAKELHRNERTIWTSYKKAKEKQEEIFREEKEAILIPVSIFKDNGLTIFESIISYLRGKEIKYSEIAKLLNRDQRNIRTIYIRTINKKKRNV